MENKKTFKELLEVDNVVGRLYQKDPEIRNTKFGYAYTQFHKKNYTPTLEKYQEEILLARIDNALEDEKTKRVLEDKENIRGFQFSKEGLRNVILKEKELETKWLAMEIEIEPYISKFVPEELSEEDREVLTGLVI